MTEIHFQTVTSKVDYWVNWSRVIGNDPVDTSLWEVNEIEGVTPIAKTLEDITTPRTKVRLSEGVVGTRYQINNHIKTVTGQEFDFRFDVVVIDKWHS